MLNAMNQQEMFRRELIKNCESHEELKNHRCNSKAMEVIKTAAKREILLLLNS